jgi:hypothetical protein
MPMKKAVTPINIKYNANTATDGSHASLVSHPDEIAKLILDAAKAVTTKK